MMQYFQEENTSKNHEQEVQMSYIVLCIEYFKPEFKFKSFVKGTINFISNLLCHVSVFDQREQKEKILIVFKSTNNTSFMLFQKMMSYQFRNDFVLNLLDQYYLDPKKHFYIFEMENYQMTLDQFIQLNQLNMEIFKPLITQITQYLSSVCNLEIGQPRNGLYPLGGFQQIYHKIYDNMSPFYVNVISPNMIEVKINLINNNINVRSSFYRNNPELFENNQQKQSPCIQSVNNEMYAERLNCLDCFRNQFQVSEIVKELFSKVYIKIQKQDLSNLIKQKFHNILNFHPLEIFEIIQQHPLYEEFEIKNVHSDSFELKVKKRDQIIILKAQHFIKLSDASEIDARYQHIIEQNNISSTFIHSAQVITEKCNYILLEKQFIEDLQKENNLFEIKYTNNNQLSILNDIIDFCYDLFQKNVIVKNIDPQSILIKIDQQYPFQQQNQLQPQNQNIFGLLQQPQQLFPQNQQEQNLINFQPFSQLYQQKSQFQIQQNLIVEKPSFQFQQLPGQYQNQNLKMLQSSQQPQQLFQKSENLTNDQQLSTQIQLEQQEQQQQLNKTQFQAQNQNFFQQQFEQVSQENDQNQNLNIFQPSQQPQQQQNQLQSQQNLIIEKPSFQQLQLAGQQQSQNLTILQPSYQPQQLFQEYLKSEDLRNEQEPSIQLQLQQKLEQKLQQHQKQNKLLIQPQIQNTSMQQSQQLQQGYQQNQNLTILPSLKSLQLQSQLYEQQNLTIGKPLFQFQQSLGQQQSQNQNTLQNSLQTQQIFQEQQKSQNLINEQQPSTQFQFQQQQQQQQQQIQNQLLIQHQNQNAPSMQQSQQIFQGYLQNQNLALCQPSLKPLQLQSQLQQQQNQEIKYPPFQFYQLASQQQSQSLQPSQLTQQSQQDHQKSQNLTNDFQPFIQFQQQQEQLKSKQLLESVFKAKKKLDFVVDNLSSKDFSLDYCRLLGNLFQINQKIQRQEYLFSDFDILLRQFFQSLSDQPQEEVSNFYNKIKFKIESIQLLNVNSYKFDIKISKSNVDQIIVKGNLENILEFNEFDKYFKIKTLILPDIETQESQKLILLPKNNKSIQQIQQDNILQIQQLKSFFSIYNSDVIKKHSNILIEFLLNQLDFYFEIQFNVQDPRFQINIQKNILTPFLDSIEIVNLNEIPQAELNILNNYQFTILEIKLFGKILSIFITDENMYYLVGLEQGPFIIFQCFEFLEIEELIKLEVDLKKYVKIFGSKQICKFQETRHLQLEEKIMQRFKHLQKLTISESHFNSDYQFSLQGFKFIIIKPEDELFSQSSIKKADFYKIKRLVAITFEERIDYYEGDSNGSINSDDGNYRLEQLEENFDNSF
ncbi:hypothetical protein ABPG74_019161 [Tetrahymena malaccensis]